MGQLNPKKENIISEILVELTRGTTFKECAAMMDIVWSLPETTFKRYWKEANERFNASVAQSQAEILNKVKDSVHERQNYAIMSKNERMEVLTSIANGTLTYKKQIPTKFGPMDILAVPDYNDRKGAISELNRMGGDYAPIQKDITSGGEKLQPINFQIVLDDGDDTEG